MPAISDYITAQCPALAALATSAPSVYSTYVSDAQGRTNQAWFGGNYAKAVALRAMHEYTLDQRNLGVGGAISSLREGSASIGYATGKGHQLDVDLEQTSYGKRLRALIRSSGAGASVVGFSNVAAAGMPTLGNAAGMISDDESGEAF